MLVDTLLDEKSSRALDTQFVFAFFSFTICLFVITKDFEIMIRILSVFSANSTSLNRQKLLNKQTNKTTKNRHDGLFTVKNAYKDLGLSS